MKYPSHSMKKQHGFTLIELSIVLVIIGLIVGGVLVGQDLIKAAEMRATLGQIEKYNTAVNTFRGKFGGLPGDLHATQASSFGLFSVAATITVGLGDGNGLIESTNVVQPTYAIGEPLIFWRHMSDANLIDGAFGSSGASAIDETDGSVGSAVSNISQSLPPAKMGRGNYLAVYAPTGATDGTAGSNYYELNSYMNITTAGLVTTQATSQMSPREAYNMDAKVDDGMPNTGNMRARGPQTTGGGGPINQNPPWSASGATGDCIKGGSAVTDATNVYWLTSETPTCAMRSRFN